MWRNGIPAILAASVMCFGYAQLHQSIQSERKLQQEALTALRGELQELHSALAARTEPALPSRYVPAPQAATPAPALLPAPGTVSPRRAADPARAPLSPREAQLQLERVLYAEGADPAWSHQAEEQARNGLRSVLPEPSQLEAVHCGTSLCRIEITHRTHDDLQHFSEQLMLSAQPALWNGAMLTTLSPDSREGQLISVIYVSREGRPLPNLAAL